MTLGEYFDHYQAAHKHPGNRICHFIGIPLILVAVILFISGANFKSLSQNWILLRPAARIADFVNNSFARSRYESSFGIGSKLAWTLFGLGWVFQFVGHAIEKTWPEFFKNPVYLLIGPLFFLNKMRRLLKS